MLINPASAQQWLALSHDELVDRVRQLVWTGGPTDESWRVLAGHPVLVARVRGILSALRAQTADQRDHAVWVTRISRVLHSLERQAADALPDIRQAPFSQGSSPRDGNPAAVKKPSPVPPVVFLAPGQSVVGSGSA